MPSGAAGPAWPRVTTAPPRRFASPRSRPPSRGCRHARPSLDRGEHRRKTEREDDDADHLQHRHQAVDPVVGVVGRREPAEVDPRPADGERREGERGQPRCRRGPRRVDGRTPTPRCRTRPRTSGRTTTPAASPSGAAHTGRGRTSGECDAPRRVAGRWRLNLTHDLQSVPQPPPHCPGNAETGSRLRMPSRPALRIIDRRSRIRWKRWRNVGTVHDHAAGWFRGLSRRSAARLAALMPAPGCARRAETPGGAPQLDVPDAVADYPARSGDGQAAHHAVAAAADGRRGPADGHAAIDRHRARCLGGLV